MIYLNLPHGPHGVGLAGDQLARALAELTEVEQVGLEGPPIQPLPGPLLERMRRTFRPTYAATRQIAYTVFDDDLNLRRVAGGMKDLFETLVPVSRWCEAALRDGGLTALTVIHQGIDRCRFNPDRAVRRRHLDRFVVFSGGKFELRKAQDVVVRAFKIFADRHADALLVVNWHNPWTKFVATMQASPYHPFSMRANGESFEDSLKRWLHAAGLDLDHVEILPHIPHEHMSDVYGDTDVALFPNRCEGGTNLVMMEYMACGRPVVATDYGGHADVVTDANSVRLRQWRPLPIFRGGEAIACWSEPNLEEVVEGLERVYQQREMLATLGRQAAIDLSAWTWTRTAREFVALLS